MVAETARLRCDLTEVTMPDELVVGLTQLTSYRTDLMGDGVARINRLRSLLGSIFPALEAAFDYSDPLILVADLGTPAELRTAGIDGVTMLCAPTVPAMPVLTTSASAALAAADAQTIALPGETDTATLVKPTARKLLDLEIKDTDKLMAAQFRTHLRAKIVESLAGMCPGMGAEFIAITGGNTHVRHRRPAGLPRRIGPLTKGFRPRHRQSAPAQATTAGCDGCLHGALSSLKVDGPSRRFYDRKRGERLIHTQALLALASRLVDVLWALCAPDANSPSMLRLRSLPELDTLIESPRQPR